MSVFDPEQLITAQKANAAALSAMTNQAFEGLQRLIKLNMQAARSVLGESEAYWQGALSCKTPEEFLAWRTNSMQPAAQHALSYSRQLYDIASDSQVEWITAATAQYQHHSRTIQTLVDNLAKDAPARPEAAVAMVKSAFSTASDACETLRKAAEQAVQVAKGNLAAIASVDAKVG
jgi:phasin family protein